MKSSIAILAFVIATASLSLLVEAASPAATQNWVKEYVSTNTAQSVAVSSAVSRVSCDAARGMSAAMLILEAGGFSTNNVDKAVDSLVNSLVATMREITDSTITFGGAE